MGGLKEAVLAQTKPPLREFQDKECKIIPTHVRRTALRATITRLEPTFYFGTEVFERERKIFSHFHNPLTSANQSRILAAERQSPLRSRWGIGVLPLTRSEAQASCSTRCAAGLGPPRLFVALP
jgi:hypothetical protein